MVKAVTTAGAATTSSWAMPSMADARSDDFQHSLSMAPTTPTPDAGSRRPRLTNTSPRLPPGSAWIAAISQPCSRTWADSRLRTWAFLYEAPACDGPGSVSGWWFAMADGHAYRESA